MSFDLITFSGIFTGVVVRSFVPFLVKLKKNPGKVKWEHKYLISAAAGFVLALLTSAIIYQQTGVKMDFFYAFTTAFTLQTLSRETQKALGF